MSSLVSVKVASIRPKYNNIKEWMNDPNNVYIGRGRIVFIDGIRYPPEDSIWANPFQIKYYISDKIEEQEAREIVIQKYKEYITGNETLMKRLPELKNKTLGCWCFPSVCHGDVLLELLQSVD